MKKLKLPISALKNLEILTKDQLKKVLGGDGSGRQSCTASCPGGGSVICYGNGQGCSAPDNNGCVGHDSNGQVYGVRC